MSFADRLGAAVAVHGPLCVGIDPHPGLLDAWGLSDDADGLARFTDVCLDALAGEVALVKPQSAFYERHGSRGVAVLERALTALRERATLSLLDVKRGDIGSTMAAYAHAHLADSAPLAADAITVSPYLGTGSLRPALDLAAATGRGVFVLARTSNPEAAALQALLAPDGRSVAQSVVDALAPEGPSVGVVVGATVAPGEIDLSGFPGPVLAPGVGAQGATIEELPAVFGAAAVRVLPVIARDVLRAGPDVARLRDTARRLRDNARRVLSCAQATEQAR